MLLPAAKFIQYGLGDISHWNSYNTIIPTGCAIICKIDTDSNLILKIGDGTKLYRDLPIIMRFIYLDGCYTIDRINLIQDVDINKVLYIDADNRLSPSEYTIADLIAYFEEDVTSDLRFNLISPIINGPAEMVYNELAMFSINVYGLFDYTNVALDGVEWTLPDTSVVYIENSLLYNFASSYGVAFIGSTVTIKARVKNKYGDYSRYAKKDFLLTRTNRSSYVLSSTVSFEE